MDQGAKKYSSGKGGQSPRGSQTSSPLPPIRFRENDILRRELLTTEAKKYAEAFEHPGGGDKALTMHQMRRFYNEVKALEAKIESEKEDGFRKNEALIGMLKAKVAYARTRPQAKVPESFVEFINKCVDAIKTKDDFKDFCLFFEAVVGLADLRS